MTPQTSSRSEREFLGPIIVPVITKATEIQPGRENIELVPINAPASGQAWLCWFQESLRDADISVVTGSSTSDLAIYHSSSGNAGVNEDS
jgi:hypothetical protein